MPTLDDWYDKYTLDTSVRSSVFGEPGKFETFGEDLEHVRTVARATPLRVWTEVDGDDGVYVVPGFHVVNRIVYYVTVEPCADEAEHYCVMTNGFLNHYICCVEWSEEHEQVCNDRCPICGRETEPHFSEDV